MPRDYSENYEITEALRDFRIYKQAVHETLSRAAGDGCESDSKRLKWQELKAWEKLMKALGE